MISRVQFLLLTLTGSIALTASAPVAIAQQVADPESHPAAKVVHEYLAMILARQWKGSADIVDESSMKGLQDDYIARISKAPTMDDEENMVRRVGKGSLDEVKAMKPREFYTAYHEGLQDRYKVDEAVLAVIRSSLKITLLSVAQEGDKTVHVLVRTKHSNGKVNIENLELVSLIKSGEKWKVALNEQAPKVSPVDGAAPASKAQAIDPVVKPAAKPAAPKPAAPKKK